MSFHQDVMEGINAFTAMRSSMKDSPYEAYYRWKLETEKEEKRKKDELIKQQQGGYAAGAPATKAPTPVVTATGIINPNPNTAMPGMGGAPPTAVDTSSAAGGLGPGRETYRRGGPVLPRSNVVHAEDGTEIAEAPPDPRNSLWGRPSNYDPRGIDTNVGETSSPYDEPRSSIAGRAWNRVFPSTTQMSPEAQRMQEINGRINALVSEKQTIEPGILRQTNSAERQAAAQRIEQINQEIAGLLATKNQRPAAPGQQGVPTPTPAQTAPQQPPVPTPQRPAPTAGPPPGPGYLEPDEAAEVERGALRPRPVPPSFPARSGLQGYPAGPAPAPGPPQQTGGGGGGGGGGAGQAAPGVGTGLALNAPAPGPGVATGPPTPLGGAPQPPAGPPPPGSLWDPNRQKAFDPQADMADPGNVRVAGPGGAVDPQQQQFVEAAKKDFNAAVNGGLHFAQFLTRQGEDHPHAHRDQHPLYAGVGAMPAGVAQNIYRAWSDNARVDPAAALTRYMVYKYNALSALGHTAEANQMAFEVLQRLNIEAARHGGIALDFMEKGEYEAAITALQQAHAFTPDGLKLAVSQDAKTGVMLDEFTGLPTSMPFRITPQFVLGSSLGLANGRGMWNMLAIRARQFAHAGSGRGGAQSVDRDAEGRGLRNELTRERLRVLKARGAGGGKKGGGGLTEEQAADARRLAALTSGKPQPPEAVAPEREQIDPVLADALSGANDAVAERDQ